jgi:hypothetical protein
MNRKPRRDDESRRGLRRKLVLASRANDATGNRELVEQHEVKAGAGLVRPDRADFAPVAFALVLCCVDDVG